MPAYVRRGIILNVHSDEKLKDVEGEKDNENENDNPSFLRQVMD